MTYTVLCPGQGTQHPAMLSLLSGNAAAQETFAAAKAALGKDVRDSLHDGAAIFRNEVAQPLICVAQLAAWNALRPHLPLPAHFAGYSVGELASYACAGAIGAGELASLARDRAQIMATALGPAGGGLIAIRGLDAATIERLCESRELWPAIVISEANCVIGGSTAALAAAELAALAQGAEVRRLKVEIPAHTPLLGAAVAAFASRLEASPLIAPERAVLSGIDASLVTQRRPAIAALSRQVALTIQWSRCMDTLYERGCRLFLELPPGTALAKIARERFGDVEARSLDDFRSLAGVVAWIESRLV